MANAILMAAGLGTRMLPLTNTTPKPLIKVTKKSMIETLIDGLIENFIDNIYIVTGYKGEQFEFLTKKYKNVFIIKNNEYNTCNNISSLYAAKDILLLNDCFICESDLYLNNNKILIKPEKSCYYGKYIKGWSDDWIFELKDDFITSIHKGGKNLYNMVGISYFTKNDASILYDIINKEYHKDKNIFWDEAVNLNINKLKLSIFPVDTNDIYEIDTPKELNEIKLKLNL